MRTFKPVLSGQGLLAAAVALLSGQAWAEVAGRATFVNGDVSVSAADGSTRTLRQGDAINGGDKITTRAGRVQISFTDGGFVSLQPNSVFGVNEYVYSNRKPEETSLFFSLVKGGMRTITGLIGKANKQSYRVNTPVATIGIRGTEYLATVTERGLIVSVGAGFVHVENGQGAITAGAGQNILVPNPGSAPALGQDKAELQVSGVDGDQAAPEELADDGTDTTQDGVSIGNVQNANGDYIFLFTTPSSLTSSDLVTGSPVYYVASSTSVFSNGGTGMLALFDQDGSQTGSTGALLKAYNTLKSPDPAAPDFDSGTLKIVNTGIAGNLSWGEFTDGSSGNNQIFDTCNDGCYTPFTLSATEFKPYIVGTPAFSNLAKGTATYELQGGTAPRDSLGQTGTLDSLKISVNLDFAKVDLAMQLTMPTQSGSNVYSVQTLNGQPIGAFGVGSNNLFYLNSNQLEVSDSSGSCGTSGSSFCSANIAGFFAGDGATQIGASYDISNYSGGSYNIDGVAALGLTGYDSSTVLASGNGYSLAYAGNGAAGPLTGVVADYDYGYFSDNSLTATFDSSGQLQSATQFGNPQFDRGTASADNLGSVGALKWGRWYSTANDTVLVAGNSTTLPTATDYLHYITGPMTQPDIFLAFQPGASASYSVQGGTTATGTDGSTGSLRPGSNLSVTFGSVPTVGVDLIIGMQAANGTSLGSYTLTGSIPTNIAVDYFYGYASGTASFGGDTSNYLSLGGTACTSGCGNASASLHGFFAGQQAQQIGLGYEIADIGRTVSGAAAFGRGAVTAPPPAAGLVAGGQ